MKHQLTFLVLFLSFAILGQESHPNFKNIKPDDLLNVVNDISNTMRGDNIILFEYEGLSPMRTIYYIVDTLKYSEAEITAEKAKGARCNICNTITFKTYHSGANRDLEIEGEKVYMLEEIIAPYLDIFPFWQKHYAPNETAESLLNNYDARVINNNKTVNIRLQKSGSIWKVWNI